MIASSDKTLHDHFLEILSKIRSKIVNTHVHIFALSFLKGIYATPHLWQFHKAYRNRRFPSKAMPRHPLNAVAVAVAVVASSLFYGEIVAAQKTATKKSENVMVVRQHALGTRHLLVLN